MSTRLHDRSPDLLLLRSLIDDVYLEGVYPGKVAAPQPAPAPTAKPVPSTAP